MRSRVVPVLVLPLIGFGSIPPIPATNAPFPGGSAIDRSATDRNATDRNGGGQPVGLTSTVRG